MNLTEPQCGTDLGLFRTKAVAAGRRNLPDQRPEDLDLAAASTTWPRTSSTWCWPASRARRPARAASASSSCRSSSPTADGSAGRAQQAVNCVGLEEKMGIHGNATCVMAYEEATGWLVGEENRGLRPDVRDDERGAARRRRCRGWPRARPPTRRPAPSPASGCRAARSPGRRTPTARPTRSSSIPTCAAC